METVGEGDTNNVCFHCSLSWSLVKKTLLVDFSYLLANISKVEANSEMEFS